MKIDIRGSALLFAVTWPLLCEAQTLENREPAESEAVEISAGEWAWAFDHGSEKLGDFEWLSLRPDIAREVYRSMALQADASDFGMLNDALYGLALFGKAEDEELLNEVIGLLGTTFRPGSANLKMYEAYRKYFRVRALGDEAAKASLMADLPSPDDPGGSWAFHIIMITHPEWAEAHFEELLSHPETKDGIKFYARLYLALARTEPNLLTKEDVAFLLNASKGTTYLMKRQLLDRVKLPESMEDATEEARNHAIISRAEKGELEFKDYRNIRVVGELNWDNFDFKSPEQVLEEKRRQKEEGTENPGSGPDPESNVPESTP